MKERIGESLILIGFLLMMGIAGADDFQTMQGFMPSLMVLIAKAIVPMLMMVSGMVMVNGGEK